MTKDKIMERGKEKAEIGQRERDRSKDNKDKGHWKEQKN